MIGENACSCPLFHPRVYGIEDRTSGVFKISRMAKGAADTHRLYDDLLEQFSNAEKCFTSNTGKTMKAVKSILNKYNTGVYLSVSPERNWRGICNDDSNEMILFF